MLDILDKDDSEPGYGALQIHRRQQRRWTTPTPMTRSELEKERQEFWDTIALYEGRPEVWRVIQSALEETDRTQIQSILDASRLVVPSDKSVETTMTHIPAFDARAQFTCYDHLGNRYVVPLKFISAPSNLIEDMPHSAMTAAPAVDVASGEALASPEEESSGAGRPLSGAGTGKAMAHRAKVDDSHEASSGRPVSSIQQQESRKTNATGQESGSTGTSNTTIIRVRLSTTQKEHRVGVSSSVATVGSVKQALVRDLADAGVDPRKHRIRIFFLGRVLADEERLASIGHFEMGVNGTMLQAQVTPLE
ncbi:Ubiquitin domain-containing protein 2 [Actinomortierella ambigua]|uniref:Ubiquitin domain-containing protein 2 n=1 Tax=Actinomortierella ambigua TaxID=1343610 RepID=A0A9P6PV90_9FUNG|nr:Ubiquitin domain-containing protein 2 [Actinomortierella ambigua]